MLKKWKIISPIILFLLSFPIHFLYTWFTNIITSFFAPVNESIFEHMKMIYTTYLLFSLIEYIYIKFKNIKVNNICINPFLSGLLNIFIFLIMYLPIRIILNESMIITFIILFISFIITSYISYKILLGRNILNKYIGITLTLIMYIPFIYYTYNPIHNEFFYDSKNEIYGIKKM